MARGFDVTLGIGATDRVTSTLDSYPAARSWFAWVYMQDNPSSISYRIFEQQIGGLAFFPNNDGFIYFVVSWTGGQASWRFPLFSTGSWHALGVSYNNSSDTNDPVFYLNATKPTVTENTAPSGTPIDLSLNTIYIGNSNDSIRPFDGMIAEFAIWDAILTDAEYLSLNAGYSPVLIRPASLVEYVPLVRDNVSLKRAAPTITGTAVQPHPRIIMPRKWRGPARLRTVPPETLFAQACL